MEEGHKPRTSVAFAPTQPFVDAFPKEVEKQSAMFTTPSWQQTISPAPEPPKKDVETEWRPKPIMSNDFVPPGTNPLLADGERATDAVNIRDVAIGLSVVAGVFLLGYLVYRCVWSASSTATSTLP